MTTATQVTIGGSEAAAAAGLDPHRSRVQLWLEKTGRAEPRDETEAMRWGTLLEGVIADHLAATDHLIYEPPHAPPWNRAMPWATGHPDRLYRLHPSPQQSALGVLEIKTTNLWRAREWEDGIPAAPLLQVQHYLALTGLRLGMVACLIGGQRLVVRRCDRDEQLIEWLLQLEEEFVGYVERDEPPPPDGSKASAEALALLYPEATEGAMVATAEDVAMVDELRRLKRAEKATTRLITTLEDRLKLRLGDHAVLIHEAAPLVRWPSVTTHRLDTQAVKEAYPTVYASCQVESSYRRFTVAEER